LLMPSRFVAVVQQQVMVFAVMLKLASAESVAKKNSLIELLNL